MFKACGSEIPPWSGHVATELTEEVAVRGPTRGRGLHVGRPAAGFCCRLRQTPAPAAGSPGSEGIEGRLAGGGCGRKWGLPRVSSPPPTSRCCTVSILISCLDPEFRTPPWGTLCCWELLSVTVTTHFLRLCSVCAACLEFADMCCWLRDRVTFCFWGILRKEHTLVIGFYQPKYLPFLYFLSGFSVAPRFFLAWRRWPSAPLGTVGAAVRDAIPPQPVRLVLLGLALWRGTSRP